MKITKEFIFDSFGAPQCHASTIIKMKDGRLLVAWFGGTKEKANDVRIWVSAKDGDTWSVPIPVTPDDNIPHWNPVLFLKDDGEIVLYYKVGYEIPDWKTFVVTSSDNGASWSEPREMIAGDESGGRGPVKNKMFRASSGRLIAPASTERGVWKAFVDVSDDGISWKKCDIPASDEVNMIQPTLWESEKGHIHALMRTNCGKVYRSDSTDNGETWCQAYETDMPNNNSGIDAVKAENGKVYLVCNPISDNWGARTPLTVYVSRDNGATFEKLIDLETEEGKFAYPAIIAENDTLYITYTWNRKKIAFVTIEI